MVNQTISSCSLVTWRLICQNCTVSKHCRHAEHKYDLVDDPFVRHKVRDHCIPETTNSCSIVVCHTTCTCSYVTNDSITVGWPGYLLVYIAIIYSQVSRPFPAFQHCTRKQEAGSDLGDELEASLVTETKTARCSYEYGCGWSDIGEVTMYAVLLDVCEYAS